MQPICTDFRMNYPPAVNRPSLERGRAYESTRWTFHRVIRLKIKGRGMMIKAKKALKRELLALGRHWATEIIHLGFKYFHYGCTGSSEMRTREYANRRLNTISKVIGEEEVRKGFRQAEQFFSKAVGQRAWKIFMEARRRSRNASRRKCRRRSPATPRKATNERR